MCGYKRSSVTTKRYRPRCKDGHSDARRHVVEEGRKQLWFITVENEKPDSVLWISSWTLQHYSMYLHSTVTGKHSTGQNVERNTCSAHEKFHRTVQMEHWGCPNLQCWRRAAISPSKLTGKVWQLATKFWILRFNKETGKPSFCTMRAYLLIAIRDCSSLLKHTSEDGSLAVQKTLKWLEISTERQEGRPLSSCADNISTFVDRRCGSWFTDPHDERLVNLKHNRRLKAQRITLLNRNVQLVFYCLVADSWLKQNLDPLNIKCGAGFHRPDCEHLDLMNSSMHQILLCFSCLRSWKSELYLTMFQASWKTKKF